VSYEWFYVTVKVSLSGLPYHRTQFGLLPLNVKIVISEIIPGIIEEFLRLDKKRINLMSPGL